VIAQDNVFTNSAGGNDSWNDAASWSLGHVPMGSENAVVDSNLTASVTTAPSNYTGNLTLREGAQITVGNIAGQGAFPGASATMTMHDQSGVRFEDAPNITFASAIVLLGDARFYTGGNGSHHEVRYFNGVISGSGSLTINNSNNNTIKLNATNTFSGGLMMANGNSRIDPGVDGAFGTGDVVIGNATSLRIAASTSNTIHDAASLYLVGAKDGKLPAIDKLDMKSTETVNKLFVDGFQKAAGDYTSSEAWLSGSGTLTVLTDPPAIPPNLVSIDDDVYGGPIYEDHPDPVNYVVSFDLDMDHTTVDSNDFENAGTAPIAFGPITETSEGIFAVQVQPTAAGTLTLQIKAGAVLETTVGARLDTTNALPDDTTITIRSGDAPVTLLTGLGNGPGGSDDNWNMATNWSEGIPFGSQDAIVGTGVHAQVETASRPYTGSLTLRENATLRLKSAAANVESVIAGHELTVHDGVTFLSAGHHGGGSITFGATLLLGTFTINNGGAHRSSFTFPSAVAGPGGFKLQGTNNGKLILTTTNTFSGGIELAGSAYLKLTSDGAAGTGSIAINAGSSLWIGAGVSNAVADTAQLSLVGGKVGDLATKVVLDSNESISELYIEGLPQQSGTWGPEGSAATHQTNLFSGAGILTVEYTEIPPAGSLLIVR